MALEDSYLRLDLDLTFPQFAAIHDPSTIYVEIGHDQIAFRPFVNAVQHQRQISGIAGGSSRMVQDTRSLVVGKNGYCMPISQLGRLNLAQVEMMADHIQRGTMVGTFQNKGTTVGTIGEDFRTGFAIAYKELRDFFVEPRVIWSGIQVAGVAPTTEDEFIFLPASFESQMVIEQEVTGGINVVTAITVYGYNPEDGTIVELTEFTGVDGDTRVRLGEDLRHQYVLPVVTGITGGAGREVSIKLGWSTTRAA